MIDNRRGARVAAFVFLAGLCAFGSGPRAQVPVALAALGDEALMRLAATGVQIYECRIAGDGGLAWTFKEPRADLIQGGRVVGRHYAGPTWELADGSRIVGRVAATVPAPQATDIPWLRLTVVSREGAGELAPVTAVQRVETRGGTLSGRCEAAGTISEVPYTADYVMLRAAR